MLKNILSATSVRLVVAAMNFIILTLLTRTLGAENMGTIALILFGIGMNQMFAALLGGSSVVYLGSRIPLFPLVVISWGWNLFVSVAGTLILLAFRAIPADYTFHVAALSFLMGTFAINQNVMLSGEQIRRVNIAFFLQTLGVFLTLILLFSVFHPKIESYLTALYVGNLIAVTLGLYFISGKLISTRTGFADALRQTFSYGKWVQGANLVQFFNYRLSYVLIEKFFDRATLGIYSTGVQLAESIWIIGRSIAMVQFSRISNNRDVDANQKLTLALFKFTVLLTLLMVAVLAVLPPGVFVWLFGARFGGASTVIRAMAIGIVALSGSLMISHYFSGTGRPKINMIASALGLIVTVGAGLLLIPRFGMVGAGLTASVSYLLALLYQLILFGREGSFTWKSFFWTADDGQQVKKLVRSLKR